MSTASLTLFENLCEREVTRRDQRTNAECLAKVADSEAGKKCLDAFNGVDLLSRDAGSRLCDSVNSILRCMANDLELECGGEALLHVYDIHYTWVHAFNSTCTLAPENNKTPPKNKEASSSAAPTTIVAATSEAPRTTAPPTERHDENGVAAATPLPEPHPEPEPEPEPSPEPTVVEQATTIHVHEHNEGATLAPDDTKGFRSRPSQLNMTHLGNGGPSVYASSLWKAISLTSACVLIML